MTLLAGILVALGVVGSGLAFHAVFIAPRQLRVIELEVTIEQLDDSFDGYTIGVLSDLHQAPLPGREHTGRAIELVLERSPDLIALLGDYGVSFKRSHAASRAFYPPGMRTLAPMLTALRAPDGVVALLGNHDYYYDAQVVREWLESLGIRVLVNDRIEIRRGGARLAIAGLDDALQGSPDPLAGCGGLPDEVPRVLLSHSPDGVLFLAPSVRPGLVLSGHTHGGQIVLPFYGAPIRWARIAGRKSARGWIPNPVAPLFVSAGVGSQVPFRFGAVPDVVIVRLRMAPK